MKKYELTDEIIEVDGKKLYRIKALVDIPKHDVKIGDFGGFVESEENLSHRGNAWVTDNARVSKNALVTDDARVSKNALVTDNARVGGNAIVTDDARVSKNALVTDNVRVTGNARVGGNAIVTDDAVAGGNALVTGDAMVGGNALVTGDAMVGGNARVTDNAWVSKNVRVTGNARVKTPEDYIVIYPIGSECGVFTAYRTENGIGCNRGCFSGTVEEFEKAVKKTHDENEFAKEYKKVIELVKLRLEKLNDE